MKETILFSILICLAKAQSKPKVCIETGTCYIGAWLTTDQGTTFAAFRGIRYAQPPLQALRFKKPQPIDEGRQNIDVSANTNIQCPQKINGQLKGQEDCLFLNVYVPKYAFDQKVNLSVMTFIHGGGLTEGDSGFDTYGPQYFMDQNVIIASMNYRLGTLGFLFLGTKEVSGNAGFRDQSLALQWIKTNIASFQGDERSITIFGESAGSISVGMHLVSPLSRGIFQRAIMQSGTPMAPWGSLDPTKAVKIGQKIQSGVNCGDLKCLQNVSLDFMFNSSTIAYRAVPDEAHETEPFLPQSPEEMFLSGDFDQEAEMMIGHTKDEGILYLLFLGVLNDVAKWSDLRDNFDEIGPMTLFDVQDKDWITQEDIKKAYNVLDFYVESRDNVNEEHKQRMIDMYSDAGFIYDNFRTIDTLLKYGTDPYFYIFGYAGEHSFTELYGVDPVGVSHGDDLFYLWKSTLANLTQADDIAIRSVMVKAWSNFAKTGKPDQSWQRASNATSFWNINSPTPKMTQPDRDLINRVNFWKDFYNPDNSAVVQKLSFWLLQLLLLQYFLLN